MKYITACKLLLDSIMFNDNVTQLPIKTLKGN